MDIQTRITSSMPTPFPPFSCHENLPGIWSPSPDVSEKHLPSPSVPLISSLSRENLEKLSMHCDEFLVHGVDVEGLRVGILVRGCWLYRNRRRDRQTGAGLA